MEASVREVESSKVREFLREVKGLPFDHNQRHDYYGDVTKLDAETDELCAWCKSHFARIKDMSLELQIWWRDHQAADAKKLKDAAEKKEREKTKQEALKKLTPAERKALGLP